MCYHFSSYFVATVLLFSALNETAVEPVHNSTLGERGAIVN